VWVALNDITVENGAVQFVRGSHKTRYPYHMVPLIDSAFFHDPFIGVDDPQVIVKLAKQCKLVLDIDTSNLFDGVNVSDYTMDEIKAYVYQKLSEKRAKLTPFSPEPDYLVTMTMRKGQFFIFTERTMHGSLPNRTQQSRLGINCRVTTTDTLIYPGRLRGDFIDSSNLDISKHHCILLSGKDKNGQNVYR
jgi:non-heme Fe2+,alpha-ketoglutarate-dependent halogenase